MCCLKYSRKHFFTTIFAIFSAFNYIMCGIFIIADDMIQHCSFTNFGTLTLYYNNNFIEHFPEGFYAAFCFTGDFAVEFSTAFAA